MDDVIHTRLRAVVAASLVFVALAGSQVPMTASMAGPPAFKTRKFATVPSPGQPWAAVVDQNRILTSTAGAFTAPLDDWRVFAFHATTAKHDASRTVVVPRLRPISLMGLGGMAFDASGRLYVADMNGRVLRVNMKTKKTEVYATVPVFSRADFVETMPFDLAFDGKGNLYIADGGPPVVWRVPPGPSGREAEFWFQDLKLQGQPSWSGLHSIALAPNGKELFLGMCQYKNPSARSMIFRLPIANPSSETLREFHAYPAPTTGPCPNGLAFGKSGKLYVALTAADAIQVLNPDGREERRFAVEAPNGIALDTKGELYIASMGTDTMYAAFVKDPAHRIVRPRIP